MKLTMFVGEGFDEELTQLAATRVDCQMAGNEVVKVTCPQGADFIGHDGTRLHRPGGWNATELCDLARLAAHIREACDERRCAHAERLAHDRSMTMFA
ncbi:hypothetical protein F2P45_09785 [Massilia sp. CCM 8733]|uniref:Uncharacterized protein n=1 Tax=Massilia mucilaginosa TaxID=2609282 RepID=A0ABX0NQZ7_9BURK|nr:hypothetical protein [Massilia mucilaginosa]NHZ89301.1 hypothetical protein [Massilia mucilaginosa]